MDHRKVSRVLAYRRRCEEHIAGEMQRHQERQRQEEKQLAALQQTRRGYQESLETSEGTSLARHEIQQWSHYHRAMGPYVATQESVVKQAAEAVVSKHNELLVARKETKIMEKLEEKALQQLRTERARHEARLIDELALMRSQYGR